MTRIRSIVKFERKRGPKNETQRSYRYFVVDVFTNLPFEGNSLAVFPDASGLDDDTMQRIARELNLSETTFVFSATRSNCVANVRIFTPSKELIFACHPTIGTSFVLLAEEMVSRHVDHFVLEEKVGPILIRAGTAAPHLAAYSIDRIWQNVRAVSLRRHANSQRE
jgi:trans-2,3-dihydro-3-hydroxyanthranilate isomerase